MFFYILKTQLSFLSSQVSCQSIANQPASSITRADLSIHICTYLPTARKSFLRISYHYTADITTGALSSLPLAPGNSLLCINLSCLFILRYVVLDNSFFSILSRQLSDGVPSHFDFEWLLYLTCSP